MKTTVRVCGIGHKQGVSKAGKPYDFYVVSGLSHDPDYMEGERAHEFNVDDSMVSMCAVGQEIHVFSHFYNGKTYVDAILPV